MGKATKKIMNFLGFTDDEDIFEEQSFDNEIDDIKVKQFKNQETLHRKDYLKMPGEVVHVSEISYDDCKEICDLLTEGKIIIINTEKTPKVEGQRILDFLSGSCFSLNGSIERINNTIFMLVPYNISFINEISKINLI